MMTIDEFMALDSHARNCVVAEKVLGWEVDRHANMGRRIETPKPGEWGCGCTSHNVSGPIPTFTTSIADAWEVVEQFTYYESRIFQVVERRHLWYLRKHPVGSGHPESPGKFAIAETAPLAICIAALLTVGALDDFVQS